MNKIDSPASSKIKLLRSARQWWSDLAQRDGRFAATKQLLLAVWEFLLDSTPARRRQRYGDADFDWDYRVDTTSGAVCWRDRLLGVFHSPYQPTESVLFHEMLYALREQSRIDFQDFEFIDLGSGKGRTLLMAADYPFRHIIGVELLPALHQSAQNNLTKYKSDAQRCFSLQTICGDATEFSFPDEPAVLYLFNPFPEAGLRRVIANLERSLSEHPRPVYVLYHNPQLERLLKESSSLRRLGGTNQYSIYGVDPLLYRS